MSETSKKLLEKTSKPASEPAFLVLEDGTAFEGTSCGASGEAFGEICFNTSLEGYLEVITDPSYAGQVITLTYPQIGNYGVNEDDVQRDRLALRGLVVRDMCHTPSNWRSNMSLPEFLKKNDVVAIEGVDTRSLVRHVRENGAMRAGISTVAESAAELLQKVRESESIVGQNLVRDVSCAASAAEAGDGVGVSAAGARDFAGTQASAPRESHAFAQQPKSDKRYNVVVYDCGAKDSILQNLEFIGCGLTVVPWDTPAEDVLDLEPDGVFLSNGPGDPDAVEGTYEQVKKLLGKVPVFGICLGHQMLAEAAGSDMEKLKYGHRGGNHPVVNLLTGRVEVTAQNHGFGMVFQSLGELVPELSGGRADHPRSLMEWVEAGVAPVVQTENAGRVQLTHVNLNDGTPEGMRFLDNKAFSVQYHPEASPGPTDAHYLFTAFGRLMDGDPDYLDIDIAKDRLQGWKF